MDAIRVDGDVMTLLVPVGEHDALARLSVDACRMTGWTVRMAVDHPRHGVHAKRALDGRGVDVEDRLRLARGCRAAAAAPTSALPNKKSRFLMSMKSP